MACPYSGVFPHKVGNLLSLSHSSCQTVPRKIEGCSGVSPTREDSESLLVEDIALQCPVMLAHTGVPWNPQPVGCSAAEPASSLCKSCSSFRVSGKAKIRVGRKERLLLAPALP